MKFLFLLIFPLFFLTAFRLSAQLNPAPFSLSTSTPQHGEKINIQYRAANTKLADQQSLECVLYYFVKSETYTEDVCITNIGGIWQGSFILPDSAQAFGLKFSDGNHLVDDNGGNGYISAVYDRSGKACAGSLAALSGFFIKGQTGDSFLRIKPNQDTVLALLQQDFLTHHGIKKDWKTAYLLALLSANKESAYPEVQKEIKKMLSEKNIKESDYVDAITLYTKMGKSQQANEVKKILFKKYPKCKLLQKESLIKFNVYRTENNVDSMIVIHDLFKQNFFSDDPNSNYVKYESFMMSMIASAYAQEKQYDKFLQYSSFLPKSTLANEYNEVAKTLLLSGELPLLADSLAKVSKVLKQYAVDHSEETRLPYYSPNEWKRMQQKSSDFMLDTYAMILAKKGDYKEALYYQKKSFDASKGVIADVNERYAEYLIKTGDYATALNKLEKFIEDGITTPKMQDYLKTAYTNIKGSDMGYANYLSGIEAKADERVKADLAKGMINQPASAFDLQDMNGQNVSLASLKGKVVILDYWATWCGPCIASFPTMQKAINKFQNDSNVVFLFINTMERTAPEVRQKQVSDFFIKNKYTFHVLLDQPDPLNPDQYQTVNAYGVNGIPAKFIIGPKGNIRFKFTGFSSKMDEEIKKLSLMIKMASK